MSHMNNAKKAQTKVERKQRLSLVFWISAVVFAVLLAAMSLAALAVWLMMYFGWLGWDAVLKLEQGALLLVGISAVLGWAFSILLLRVPLVPFNEVINKMNQLAAGDFRVSLEYKGAVANVPAFREMSVSFNKLAEQLRNTELLRGDFINNFSHEFKTPIVSIAGFARLLRHGALPPEEQEQYLVAIEEESMRLAYMATNVLNLTKVENQTILTDITNYNLSEQLRSCLLLLEAEWSKKELDIDLDLEEYSIRANEELLKQVWINLLDNAIKFTPPGGRITLTVTPLDGKIAVSILNTGSEIPPDKLEKIFNKFYQCDESHAGKGNGVGLAIVRRITELHGGNVGVQSGGGCTVFTVTLPM